MRVKPLALALGLCLLPAALPGPVLTPVAHAEAAWSLVFEGRISDVAAVRTPEGSWLSTADLASFLKRLGDVNLQTRPDRGLMVIDSRHGGGEVAAVSGFTGSALTLIVNDSQMSAAARMEGGVPFISEGSFQKVLEALGMSSQLDQGAALITVARAPRPAADAPAGGGSYAPTGMPGSSFPGLVLQGTSGALGVLGGLPGGVSGGGSAVASRSAEVCAAMDALRQAWHETEPTRQEKATFQNLAEKFQNAQQGGAEISMYDAADLEEALGSFKAKVDRRAQATRGWEAPIEAARVKQLGTQFLGSYQEIMSTMYAMAQDMTFGNTYPMEEIDAKVSQIKELERVIQALGPQFDAEVLRVRTTYGCGPATLESPGS